MLMRQVEPEARSVAHEEPVIIKMAFRGIRSAQVRSD
jgi:hypothetical protein